MSPYELLHVLSVFVDFSVFLQAGHHQGFEISVDNAVDQEIATYPWQSDEPRGANRAEETGGDSESINA